MQVFDAHCDTLWRCDRLGLPFPLEDAAGHWDLARARGFDAWTQFFAIFADARGTTRAARWETLRRQRDILARAVGQYPERLAHCLNSRQAAAAHMEGKIAAFLSVEGADLLGCSIVGLEAAYELGVRAVNLTWNRANALSGSAVEEADRGLSPLGGDFVRRMQELGMLVDLSHLSEPGFWDVLSLAQKPVMASHSNAKACCDHPRNLTDAQFLALCQNGGVVGLNLYTGFLGTQADLDTVTAHLEHFWSLGGSDHLALGGDWDGCDSLPQGFADGIAGLHRLYDHLLQRNYSTALLEKLYDKNLLRVVNDVCTM